MFRDRGLIYTRYEGIVAGLGHIQSSRRNIISPPLELFFLKMGFVARSTETLDSTRFDAAGKITLRRFFRATWDARKQTALLVMDTKNCSSAFECRSRLYVWCTDSAQILYEDAHSSQKFQIPPFLSHVVVPNTLQLSGESLSHA